MKKDLTTGNVYKQIFTFTVPIMLGQLLSLAFSMVDTAMVGRMVSSDALSGVGSVSSLVYMILGLVNGLSAGFSIRTAQYFGSGDREKMKKSIAASYELTLICSLIITVAATPLSGVILKLMKTPAQYFRYSLCYLQTVFIGAFATALYNMTAGNFRAIGDSKTPLVFLIISGVLNAGLNALFLLVFKMYYYGVGLATVLSSLFCGVASTVYYFAKNPDLLPSKNDFRNNGAIIWGHLKLGLPIGAQNSITAVGLVFQQAAVNGLNADYPGIVTAIAAATKPYGILTRTCFSLADGITSFAGQNYGAGRLDRVRKGIRVSMLYVLISWGLSFTLSYFFGGWMTSIFIDMNKGDAAIYGADIMRYGRLYLMMQTGFMPILGSIVIVRGAVQSMGYSTVTMIGGAIELATRSTVALVFVRFFGLYAALVSDPSAWFTATVFIVIAYSVIMKKEKKRLNE